MITQILNIFDPGTSNFYQLNWCFLALPLLFPYFNSTFTNQNIPRFLVKNSINFLCNAFNPLSKFSIPFLFTCFSLLVWNLSGLFPFNFTVRTQFLLTVSLALPLWLTPFINSLLLKSYWPSHLTPANLPALPLAIFMSLIELVSCFLRPLTLSLRLMINLTAGHLILSLVALSQGLNFFSKQFIIVALIMFLFLILEFAVAIIQSYVFSMLTLLYSKEN